MKMHILYIIFSPSKFSVDLANVAEEWKIPSSQKEQMNSLGQ